MNALDAARPGEIPTLDPPAAPGSPVVLEDAGPGLLLDSFVVGGTSGGDKVIGRFGLGLKDAIPVLMRSAQGAAVRIDSRRGGYDFAVREGVCNAATVHVRERPPSERGTRVEVVGLADAAAISAR